MVLRCLLLWYLLEIDGYKFIRLEVKNNNRNARCNFSRNSSNERCFGILTLVYESV